MNCPKCGAEVGAGAESCNACGEPLASRHEGQPGAAETGYTTTSKSVAYAGFWLRAAAYLLDGMTLGFILGTTVLRPILLNNHVGTSLQDFWDFYTSGTRQATAFVLLVQLATWLYFASFESSRWQATPGKRVLGLRVTDLEGKRTSFVRASGRYFGKLISGLILGIGFAMAGFTEKKQALHDMLAGCLVVKNT